MSAVCFYLNLSSFSLHFTLNSWNGWSTFETIEALKFWSLPQMVLCNCSPSFNFTLNILNNKFECHLNLLRSNSCSEGYSILCMHTWVYTRGFLKFILGMNLRQNCYPSFLTNTCFFLVFWFCSLYFPLRWILIFGD